MIGGIEDEDFYAPEKLKLDLLAARINYNSLVLQNSAILGMSAHRDSVINTVQVLKKTGLLPAEIEKQLEDNNEDFQMFEQFLEWEGKTYLNLIGEQIYIGSFQNLETFIADSLTSIFSYFPKFLSRKEKTINVPIEAIATSENIEELQRKIAAQKVKSLLQANNIYKLIEEIEKILKMKFAISEGLKQTVFLVSRCRNLLIHNRGKVNFIFLSETERAGITVELEENDSLAEFVFENLEKHMQSCAKFQKDFQASLLGDIRRLEHYHSAI